MGLKTESVLLVYKNNNIPINNFNKTFKELDIESTHFLELFIYDFKSFVYL
jgi:hypothetical protein